MLVKFDVRLVLCDLGQTKSVAPGQVVQIQIKLNQEKVEF